MKFVTTVAKVTMRNSKETADLENLESHKISLLFSLDILPNIQTCQYFSTSADLSSLFYIVSLYMLFPNLFLIMALKTLFA